MNRRTYIYCAVPLITLLGCGVTFVQLTGAGWALVLGCVLAVVTWALLWARLFDNKKFRPEFALLGILPALIYFILTYTGQTGDNSPFTAPVWQNIYFLLILAAVAVQIASFCPGSRDEARRPAHDPVLIFLCVLLIINGFFTWVHYASSLFPIN